jgi:hypothetical protein
MSVQYDPFYMAHLIPLRNIHPCIYIYWLVKFQYYVKFTKNKCAF